MLALRLGLNPGWFRLGSGGSAQALSGIVLSNDEIASDAQADDTVGFLFAIGGVEPVTFSIVSQEDNDLTLDGNEMEVAVGGDLSTVGATYDITIRATDDNGATTDQAFAITIMEVSNDSGLGESSGTIVIDDGWTSPPKGQDTNNGFKIVGKNGGIAKVVYNICSPPAGGKYTIRYSADWSNLSNEGRNAFVGFGFIAADDDFHLSGLKGDGEDPTTMHAYQIEGMAFSNAQAVTQTDGGAASNGTKDGDNWLQIENSTDGLTYTLRSSAAGSTWDDEFTAEAPMPLVDVDEATKFGVAVFLPNSDKGVFEMTVELWELAALIWDGLLIDSGLGAIDGIDARDVTGNGLQDLLIGNEDGQVWWYEQTSAGVFMQHTIRSTAVAGSPKQESACWAEVDGTIVAVRADQARGEISVFVPDNPADLTGTWTRGVIQATRPSVQFVGSIDLDGDGNDEILYAFEGESSGVGGVSWLDWTSGALESAASWTDRVIRQRDGAWWIEEMANGDLAFSAREQFNPSADAGVFLLTKPVDPTDTPWVETTIVASANDWTQIALGDFFGNGNEDIAAVRGPDSADTNVYFYDSANAWAETVVNLGVSTAFNVKRAGYKTYCRDAIFTSGIGGVAGVWQWNGSTWVLDRPLIVGKADNRVPLIGTTSLVFADSDKGTLTLIERGAVPGDDLHFVSTALIVSASDRGEGIDADFADVVLLLDNSTGA